MGENLIETHARESAGMPPEWEVWHFEVVAGGKPFEMFRLTGAVAPLKTRGKWKGRRDWKKKDPATERTVYIPGKDHDAWLAAWEARTGKCSRCTGEGRTLKRASAAGTEYRPCRDCGGTGRAKAPAEAEAC